MSALITTRKKNLKIVCDSDKKNTSMPRAFNYAERMAITNSNEMRLKMNKCFDYENQLEEETKIYKYKRLISRRSILPDAVFGMLSTK